MVIDYSFGSNNNNSNNDSDFRSICMFKHWTNSLISVICSHTIFLILIPFIHPSILTFICESMEFFRNLGQNFFLMKILYLKKKYKKANKQIFVKNTKQKTAKSSIHHHLILFIHVHGIRRKMILFFLLIKWIFCFSHSPTHTHILSLCKFLSKESLVRIS